MDILQKLNSFGITYLYENYDQIISVNGQEYFDTYFNLSLKDLGEAEYRLWAKFMHDHKLTDLFCGTTKVYSECVDHSLNYPSGRWNLDQMKFGNCVIHQPYYNLHRHDIVNKYLEYDVLEMLFDTQSCAKIASDGVPCNKISCEQCSDRYEGLKRAFTNTKYEYIIEQDRNRKLEDVEWTKC